MTEQHDKKQNLTLIIGLSIPVAMILFIAVAINGPRWFSTIEPAQFDFLYTTGQPNPYVTYTVDNGRLVAKEPTLPEGSIVHRVGDSGASVVLFVRRWKARTLSSTVRGSGPRRNRISPSEKNAMPPRIVSIPKSARSWRLTKTPSVSCSSSWFWICI